MRILIINTFYYPKFTGGAEISVQILAEGLVKAGHDVYVLTTGASNKVYSVNGVRVISCKQRNVFSTYYKYTAAKGSIIKAIWHFIDSANVFYHFKLSGLLNKISPDIVHTNNIQGFSPMVWYTVKKNNIKLVHTLRDYYLLCHKANCFDNNTNCEKLCSACKVTHSIKSKFASYPDTFVGISNYIVNRHIEYIPMPAKQVIYNSANLVLVPGPGAATNTITFGYLGRITADKGVEYLVDELATLSPKQMLSFKIIFAGNGDPDFIDSLKGKLGSVNYEFVGVVNATAFYKSIDVLLIPSLWNEPFGRTVIEALAHAVPVCQSDRGGLKEIFDSHSSWMFSPEKGVLAALLSRILHNKHEIEDKKRKCAKHVAHFSSKNYISKHLELYGQLIGDTSSKLKEVSALHN